MSSPRPDIPDAVRDAQARASNPEASAFVAANAGSGKTHVLVNRVIRLLLNGVPPERFSASPLPRRRPPTWRSACSRPWAAG